MKPRGMVREGENLVQHAQSEDEIDWEDLLMFLTRCNKMLNIVTEAFRIQI